MDIPLSISQMGKISEEEYMSKLGVMADAALKDSCIETNPRGATKEDIMRIYAKLWK